MFRCVVNIPEDAVRVGEPAEGELALTATTMGKLYGSTAGGAVGALGPDEMNGRVNPALETDDDDPALDLAELKKKGATVGDQAPVDKPLSNTQL